MPNSTILSGLTIYTEQGILNNATVEISAGRIKQLGQKKYPSSPTILEFPSSYHLVPGFIDLHVHGANGKDVMDANPGALSVMSAALAKEGVTGFLATTMTAPTVQIESVLQTVREFSGSEGAKILGIHLEGPFISPEKIGAQNREYLLPLRLDAIRRWQKLSGQNIKMVTFAPELADSELFIQELKQLGIIPSIGHTNATYAESKQAITDGCTHVTHLFNAMRGIHQREPGVVTAALLSDEVSVEIIVDGVHVHPALVQLTLKMKGRDHLVLVTDAMRAKCLQDGTYELGGQSVEVKNTVARLSDGTLAGSTLKNVFSD